MKMLVISLFCAICMGLLFTGCQQKLAESPYGAREQGWEEFIKNTYPDWEPPHTVPPEKENIVVPEQEDVPVIISDTEIIENTENNTEVIAPTINSTVATQNIEATESNNVEATESNIASEFQTYTIQKGDTLWKIARKFYGSGKEWRKIFQANQDTITNPDKIKSGIEIKIPATH